MRVVFFILTFLSVALAKSACPLADGCPYIAKKSQGVVSDKPCPLESAGCPYFEKHKKDKDIKDLVNSDNYECPMEKCPYFEKLKNGTAETQFETKNCPLAEKCPYYEKVKKSPESLSSCPLVASCPHFKGKKDAGEKEGCPHFKKGKDGKSKDYNEAVKKCPHLAKKANEQVKTDL